MAKGKVHALTLAGNGLLRVLSADVAIAVPNTNKTFRTKAIWDTGASASVITQQVATSLGLTATGKKPVHTANGVILSDTYIVDIFLKEDLRVAAVPVTIGTITDTVGCLIGMDIINLGDFSITNKDMKTVMSFRVPSMHCIDFVKDTYSQNRKSARDALRNQPKKRRR